nr:MAG TPA: hypothetical protein [Caudoviricetes sp.]
MWIKRTMASGASQSVYISDHNNAERRTSEASQLTRLKCLYII